MSSGLSQGEIRCRNIGTILIRTLPLLLCVVASGCAVINGDASTPIARFCCVPACILGHCGGHHDCVPPPHLWHYQPTCWQPLAPDLAGECVMCGELEAVPASEEPASDELQAPPASMPSEEPAGSNSAPPTAAPAPKTEQSASRRSTRH